MGKFYHISHLENFKQNTVKSKQYNNHQFLKIIAVKNCIGKERVEKFLLEGSKGSEKSLLIKVMKG